MEISTLSFSGKVYFSDKEGVLSMFDSTAASTELFTDMKVNDIINRISNSDTYKSMYDGLL